MSKIVFRHNVNIGAPAAEDDEKFLQNCFVEMAAYEQLVDLESPKSILLGRTGSGKSALLLEIEKNEDACSRIDPREFSFDYISNSNVLSYVLDLGCNLNPLFEFLWLHVLLSKIITSYFETRSSFDKVLDLGRMNSPARRYYEKYRNTFWQEQSESTREISEGVAADIRASLLGVLGQDATKIESGLSADLKINQSQKKTIVQNITTAVSKIQIRDLKDASKELETMMLNRQKSHYVLIDDLDSDWSESRIKYQLIRSLINTLKPLRKIRRAKVLVSLRTDTYEKSIYSAKAPGDQPEKDKGITTEIRWTKDELTKVLDRRIEYILEHVYTKKAVTRDQILDEKTRKSNTIDYLIDRTQYRPRDLIAFFNEILEQSVGTTKVTATRITIAEADYSRNRYEALANEWEVVHPQCRIYLRQLKDRSGNIKFDQIANSAFVDDFCLSLDLDKKQPSDNVEALCSRYFERNKEQRISDIASALLATLYKMGAIELKPSKGDVFRSCYTNTSHILPEQISNESVACVSPMLWRTLGITPNIGN